MYPHSSSWSAKIAVTFQLGIWFTVGVILLHTGITTIRQDRHVDGSAQPPIASSGPCHNASVNNDTVNSTAVTDTGRAPSDDGNVVVSSKNPVPIGGGCNTTVTATAEEAPQSEHNNPDTFLIRRMFDARQSAKPSGVVMIAVGCIMLIIGPFVLIFREWEVKRDKKQSSKPDPPPSYDEVVEVAPRYSMLFDINEMEEAVPINNNHPDEQENRNGAVRT